MPTGTSALPGSSSVLRQLDDVQNRRKMSRLKQALLNHLGQTYPSLHLFAIKLNLDAVE